jgi:ribosomal protein S18 acetylase RimI-like enzyme
MQVRRAEVVDVLEGDGAVAEIEGRRVGLITWTRPQGGDLDGAEVRALAVAVAARGQGVGRALLEAAEDALRVAGVRRAWLVTTNDNLAALALYQKAGWRLATLRAGALDEARRTLKPSLPEIGQHGIALRDELELERDL